MWNNVLQGAMLGVGFAIGTEVWEAMKRLAVGWWREGTKPPPGGDSFH